MDFTPWDLFSIDILSPLDGIHLNNDDDDNDVDV
jgi:hypothetical protein